MLGWRVKIEYKHTFAASDDRDIARPRANIVDDGPLYPGNEEVSALADDGVLDTRETIEDDSSRTTINWLGER